ncbi:Os06g0493432 [Oryza sativa Japonica Group]|uniref:Os06g0493432 protein n=1 Tax=Oryza sativa subsp. japonica TaxID=39947 RepID=A0A0N7KM55_ORYSJ|nr:Os06g0493432 [Oryza sativa Japonica Group]
MQRRARRGGGGDPSRQWLLRSAPPLLGEERAIERERRHEGGEGNGDQKLGATTFPLPLRSVLRRRSTAVVTASAPTRRGGSRESGFTRLPPPSLVPMLEEEEEEEEEEGRAGPMGREERLLRLRRPSICTGRDSLAALPPIHACHRGRRPDRERATVPSPTRCRRHPLLGAALASFPPPGKKRIERDARRERERDGGVLELKKVKETERWWDPPLHVTCIVEL